MRDVVIRRDCRAPLSLQPKLLRALRQRQHRRLMGIKMVDFDIRVISATNRDLRQSIADGRFWQDLFYRLYEIPVADRSPLLSSLAGRR